MAVDEYAIGVDVGGTKIEAALIDNTGDLLALQRVPTDPEDGPPAVMTRIIACIEELMGQAAEGAIAGVGIGTPGAVDSRQGIVLHATNLGWQNIPLRRVVVGFLGLEWDQRVWIDNDTNAAALGEWMYGAGRGTQHLLYVTVGTGVGSGMVLNGQIYHGANGGAGEIGHIVLDPDGEPCRCGRRGCLETFIAGPAITRQVHAALKRGMPSSLSHMNPEAITGVEIVSAAMTGDWLARSVLENAGVYLGMVLASYVSINNPEVIVVGGGVGSAAGELLLEAARQIVRARSLPDNANTVRIVPAALGGAAGAIGAAALVWYNAGAATPAPSPIPLKVG